MPEKATIFDLAAATLGKGAPERFELELYLAPIHIAGQDYRFHPDRVSAQLIVTLLDNGYSVSMSLASSLAGACWRCLGEADLELDISVEDFFDNELPPVAEMGEEEEASLWYSEDGLLDLSAWARDAVSEMLPPKILCAEDCRGLCAQCGTDLNFGTCDCKPPTDFRWEKLKDWRPR